MPRQVDLGTPVGYRQTCGLTTRVQEIVRFRPGPTGTKHEMALQKPSPGGGAFFEAVSMCPFFHDHVVGPACKCNNFKTRSRGRGANRARMRNRARLMAMAIRGILLEFWTYL